MAENEQSHRHIQETKVLELDTKELKAKIIEVFLGQTFAFIIALFTVAVGAYTAIHGAQIPGSIFGTTGLALIVYAFLQGRK
jgi:uncharacterized membrane protein